MRTTSLAGHLESLLTPMRDVESVASALFAAVGERVPFDFACLATLDPASELITGAIKSRPLPVGDEEFAAAEYGGPDVNLFTEIARRPVPVGVLSIDTGGALDTCGRFRDFMAPRFGFTDELRVACLAQGTAWGAFALYRGPGEAPFTAADAELLGGVQEIVAGALRRALFAAPAAGGDQADGGAPSLIGSSVLIVDAADRVTDLTAGAADRIDELGGWDHGSLPPNVLAVVALTRASGEPAGARVRTGGGQWLALRAMALAGGSVVVTVDRAAASEIGQLALAARGLTAREQEVAQQVLLGASTKAIAAHLFLSPHTVQDHLKAVFRKLGVTSRREMIAQLVLEH